MSPAIKRRDDRIRDFDFELDQMLLLLVLAEHPEWRKADGSCRSSCWLEVQRLRADADGLEPLRG